MKGLKVVAKEEEDELSIGQKKNKVKEVKGEKKAKGQLLTDLNFVTSGPPPGSSSREERGGDRGSRGGGGGGGRGGRGGEGRGESRGTDRGGKPRGPPRPAGGGGKAAINLEDASAFPSLG
jgi:hypothetical protein